MDNVYQNEAVRQLAAEFGLQSITPEQIGEREITRLLAAIETERINPNHYSPDKWVKSFFMFLRETGKYPKLLEDPRFFALHVVYESRYSGGS